MEEDVFRLVIRDLEVRSQITTERFGAPFTVSGPTGEFGGADLLESAYEEVLDLAAYLRKEIARRRKT